MYGAFVGGLNFSLATFVLERSRIRHFARDWGFVQGGNSTAQKSQIIFWAIFWTIIQTGNQITTQVSPAAVSRTVLWASFWVIF